MSDGAWGGEQPAELRHEETAADAHGNGGRGAQPERGSDGHQRSAGAHAGTSDEEHLQGGPASGGRTAWLRRSCPRW